MPTTLEQPAPSFADVWRMFQETDRQMKETALQIKESDRLMKELIGVRVELNSSPIHPPAPVPSALAATNKLAKPLRYKGHPR